MLIRYTFGLYLGNQPKHTQYAGPPRDGSCPLFRGLVRIDLIRKGMRCWSSSGLVQLPGTPASQRPAFRMFRHVGVPSNRRCGTDGPGQAIQGGISEWSAVCCAVKALRRTRTGLPENACVRAVPVNFESVRAVQCVAEASASEARRRTVPIIAALAPASSSAVTAPRLVNRRW